MASYERASLPVRSRNEGNSRTCVILCISKAGYEGDTSCLYAAKVDDDGSLGRGDPFRLTNNQGRYIWNNNEISMLRIRVGDIVKCHVAGNQYVYDVKTSKRMNNDQIRMDLSHGFNTYKGMREACPEATIGRTKGYYLLDHPKEPKIFLVSIAGGIIQNERIIFLTKSGECINLKLNCRENLTLSIEPFLLQSEPLTIDDVEDVAVVKFSTSPVGQQQIYPAVCEGLMLRCKANVISVEEEPVKIMNGKGNFVVCPAVLFDTGNSVATGISSELVTRLNLQERINHTDKQSYFGVGRDEDGNQIERECSTIPVTIKIRKETFPVKALYGIPAKNTDLLIGMDIIDSLFDKNFTLGK